jgi:type VI secretion system secreted protein VgrG
MLVDQAEIHLKVNTPLGDNVLLVDRLTGVEQASAPYCFIVEMHSAQQDIDFSSLVAKEVQVHFDYGSKKRYFCGIVGEIEQQDTLLSEDDHYYCKYVAKIFPKFWLLKFTQDYHIFQNKTTIDIIKKVLQAGHVTKIEDQTTSCGRDVREYCVQYGESHFDFVSRLMEEVGIFYYFKHTSSGETLVLCDDSSSLSPAEGGAIKVIKSSMDRSHLNFIMRLHYKQQVVAKAFATADYNFTTASTKLYNTVDGEGKGGKVYRYPGIYEDSSGGDDVSTHRIQELEWYKTMISGVSTTPKLLPMFTMTVSDHPRDDLNRGYILYRVAHDIQIDLPNNNYIYTNEFEAFPDDILFRAPIITPKPIIPSTQTAVVTGKSGEEIWCDEYGRIKVKFYWDQYGSDDEKSSCWIRVAQLWAGSNWGGLWTPRVGMEVVVTFLEGNPDRPLITGCVYNSDNMPPYAQDEPTKSTIKSNTTKGGDGFNEIRFEDKKDSEEIYIHAQKDHNTVVEDNRTLTINRGDDTSDIMAGDRTVTLHGDKVEKHPQRGDDTLTLTKGSRTVELKGQGQGKGSHTLDITKGDNIIMIKKGDFNTTQQNGHWVLLLNQGNSNTTLQQGNMMITIASGSILLSVSKGIGAKIGGDVTIKVDGNVKVKCSGKMDLESTGDMTLKSMGNINLKASADIKMTASANIKMNATANIETSSTADTKISSTGNTKIAATMNFDAEGLMSTVKAKTSGTFDGGVSATVTSSAATEVKGGAVVNVTSPLINLG